MMGRHRLMLTPWWRRNPANTAIAMSALLATGATGTGAALDLAPTSQQTYVDPDPTLLLTYGPTSARTGPLVLPSTHAPTPAPKVAASRPTDPPTVPQTIPTKIVTVAPAAAVPPAPPSIGERLVYLASLQKGKPYVYGGVGPAAFDCSGLVHYVYQQLGRTIPRTAQAQYVASTKVAHANKQIGDLIFFGTPNNIYHEGIYAGNNQMWVAPHAGAPVQLETIWTANYLVGRIS